MTIKKYIRVSTFYIDSRVKNRVTNSDYRKSGYDRGHLTPIANFRFDYLSMQQTNYYTNICPQKPRFNRGIWKKLENKVRKWVLEYDTLYIVSGPIFSDTNKTIGNNLTIPNKFFKTINFFSAKKGVDRICSLILFSSSFSQSKIETLKPCGSRSFLNLSIIFFNC